MVARVERSAVLILEPKEGSGTLRSGGSWPSPTPAGWLSRALSEIGSDLNGRRPKILKLLADPAVQTIVVDENMVEVFASFLARLYGRRSARNRTKKTLAALEAN